MRPGRELDALVAEKVMGLECGIISGKPKVKGSNCGTYGCTRHWIDTPNYSTDIAAAWELVEKMKSEGFTFAVEYGHEISAVFSKRDYVSDRIGDGMGVSGESVPHAICLAALEATGEI